MIPQFKAIFSRPIVSAEIIEDEDGQRVALLDCAGVDWKMHVPVLPESQLGFRGDLIGTHLVIGFSKP